MAGFPLSCACNDLYAAHAVFQPRKCWTVSDVEMHQIRYFLATSRILNFTRAAEECNVAQPSLTRAIKLLEHELGGDLFAGSATSRT